jgi:pimeloyl-ACP methyl ester carboxylesterase
LVFVHGAFAGAWCWDEHFLPFFQGLGYDCHALNLRGHGDDADWFSLQLLGIGDYRQDVAWAIEQCDQPPVLIGHSMGAFAILQLLQRHEIRLAGLVLMSPGSPENHFAAALRFLLDFPLSSYKLNALNALPKPIWPWIMTGEEMRRLLMSPATSLETLQGMMPKMQYESFLAMTDMLRTSSRLPPTIACPKLVLSGEDDIIVPPEFALRTAKWIGAETRILPAMGHSLMVEDGWRTAATTISEWMSQENLDAT